MAYDAWTSRREKRMTTVIVACDHGMEREVEVELPLPRVITVPRADGGQHQFTLTHFWMRSMPVYR